MVLNYRNFGRLWRVYGRSVIRYSSLRKISNALRTEWAYRRRSVDALTIPYVLFIEPIYRCNLHCPLCPRETHPEAREGEDGRLHHDLIEKLFDELGDYLYQCHIFGNGEPMMDWPRTKRIIGIAHRRRIFTLMSTNCTVMTERNAEELICSGLDYLVCAIDGTSQQSYEKYRVGGNYELALSNMRRLCQLRDRLRSKISLEWQFLAHGFNSHEITNARRIAGEIGIHLRVSPLGGIPEQSSKQWLPADGSWNQNFVVDHEPVRGFPCYWLWRAIVVNANGQLGRCPGHSNMHQLGSFASSSILSIYHGQQTRKARKLFVRGPVVEEHFPAPCETCDFFSREHGACRDIPKERNGRVALPIRQ